jgi:hypothetical protein
MRSGINDYDLLDALWPKSKGAGDARIVAGESRRDARRVVLPVRADVDAKIRRSRTTVTPAEMRGTP